MAEKKTIKNKVFGWELTPINNSELPDRKAAKGYSRDLIEQFAKSRHACCKVRLGNTSSATLISCLRAYIRNHVAEIGNIRAYRLNKEVYLINYDIREDRVLFPMHRGRFSKDMMNSNGSGK